MNLALSQMEAIVAQHATQIQSPFSNNKKIILIRYIAANIFISLMQYTGLMISSLNNVMPIAFATGSACAFIFLRGYSILPGIWIGSAAAFWITHQSTYPILLHASILTIENALIFWFSCRFIIPTLLFYKKAHLLKFIILIGFITGTCNWMMNHNPMEINFWLADLNGIFILGCLLITWDAYFPQINHLKNVNLFPFILCSFIVIISIGGLLLTTHSNLQWFWFAVNFASCFIVNYRYQWCGSVCIQAINGLIICFSALFFKQSHESFTILQIYLLMNCLLCYFLLKRGW